MLPLRQAHEQWLFDPAALDHTPSRADGIDLEHELRGRREAIMIVRSLAMRTAQAQAGNTASTANTAAAAKAEAAKRPPPPQVEPDLEAEVTKAKGTVTVAAVLVHRFFMRRSLKDFEPKMIAPTILFLASKIEEGAIKLRYIINSCLAKFEPGAKFYEPVEDMPETHAAGPEYRRWEREVLAMEEVVLEALCFDMVVEQPWPVLRRSIRGLDKFWIGQSESSTDGAPAGLRSEATEAAVDEIGWVMLNEGSLSPLAVLYRPETLALATFALIIAMVDEVPLSVATATAAELGTRFGLDVAFDADAGATGEDLAGVKDAIRHYVQYCNEGIIDRNLVQYPEPSEGTQTFQRRFQDPLPEPPAANASNGSTATTNGWRAKVNGLAHSAAPAPTPMNVDR
ncbi:hypothetical protein Q8F55_006973 [Vanrija albida]|uniref:Cyclin N-terminal domain-containing protein n=1 Tax=Vanrija albida TaxID=181172 RepID=A0ABR3PYS7_9TREE